MDNPYRPPELAPSSDPSPPREKRWAFLVLPILVPPAVHFLVRTQIPRDESVAHMAFVMVAIAVAFAWEISMVDRLRLTFWKSYLLVCALAVAIVVIALITAQVGSL